MSVNELPSATSTA